MLSQVEGIGDSFLPASGNFGELDAEKLAGLVEFMSTNGFIENAPEVDTFVDTEFVN